MDLDNSFKTCAAFGFYFSQFPEEAINSKSNSLEAYAEFCKNRGIGNWT